MISVVGSINLALFVLFIQLATVAAAESKCEKDGLYGNPENCLKFIICAHGQQQDFDCPQGMSWHADRGLCDVTDLSKCSASATGASSGGSEDVFKQHLLSLLADFKPCHAGETTPATGTTVGGSSSNPGQGGNASSTPGDGGHPTTMPGTAPPRVTTPNPGQGGNASSTPGDGGHPTTMPGTAPPRVTTPNPGQGGNASSTPNSGGPFSENPGNNSGSTTVMPPSSPLPLPTCPACPIPTEKPCPTVATCPTVPTCPPAPKCDACPVATEKVCPTVAPCTTAASEKLMCDDGWKYFAETKSCYFLGIKTITSDAAKDECTKQGATLASIHSEAENTFIFNLVSPAPTTPQFTVFIGLYRTGPGVNDFANYDKTPVDYRRWAETQPDNGGASEYCSELFIRYGATIDSYWNDIPCSFPRPAYVCKKAAKSVVECPACPTLKPATCPPFPACPNVPNCPAPEPVPKCPAYSPPANKTSCDDGWKYLNSTDSCYFVGKEPLNGIEARQFCKSQGADLASIHSDSENTFITEYALSIALTFPERLFWIGSYRYGLEPTQFANYDTTPMDYTNWRPVPTQQPDNHQGVQFCTGMIPYAPYYAQWDDGNCVVPLVYVCKKPLN